MTVSRHRLLLVLTGLLCVTGMTSIAEGLPSVWTPVAAVVLCMSAVSALFAEPSYVSATMRRPLEAIR